MIVTAEIHAPGYAPIVETFRSLRDAVTYCQSPSDVVPIGGEWHARSFWPCWPDCADDWGQYLNDDNYRAVGLVWFGAFSEDDLCDRYPDREIVVGPRGGFRVVPC